MNAQQVFDRLTPMQKEVARFAQCGLRNRQIAAHCGTSEQVIKNVLGRVFDIVGCDSRLELAVWMTEEKVR